MESQPVYVLHMGLAAVFTPGLLKAGSERAAGLASRLSFPFKALLSAGALLYLLAVSFAWPLNPLPRLLPSAYVVAWAIPLTILALLLQGILHPARSELMSAGHAPRLLRLEIASSSLLCLLAATAPLTGVLAVHWVEWSRALSASGCSSAPAHGSTRKDDPNLRRTLTR